MVILHHALPKSFLHESLFWLHIGQAVPIFIFLTAYLQSLYYKNALHYYSFARIKSVLCRVVLPFFIVLVLQVLTLYIRNGYWMSPKNILLYGGIGPGSYYLSVFVLAWLLVPLFIELIRKLSLKYSFLVTLFIAVLLELVFLELEGVKYMEQLYRLLPVRHLMIIYLGCVFDKLKNYHVAMAFAAFVGGICLTLSVYNVDDIRYVTSHYWEGREHWYSASYVFLFIILFQNIHFSNTIKLLGKCSWEIFLIQMFIFSLM